eukprot:snap_masked-scaffold127_size327531-processed-gene-2.4 protein:Tk07887 transcript:snap_masked-scaffold127_size327531-processed-gene-2.4-mRNA-1 annotation:"hypothetical protein GLAREA_08303"
MSLGRRLMYLPMVSYMPKVKSVFRARPKNMEFIGLVQGVSALPSGVEGPANVPNGVPHEPARRCGNALDHETPVEESAEVALEGDLKHLGKAFGGEGLDGFGRPNDDEEEDDVQFCHPPMKLSISCLVCLCLIVVVSAMPGYFQGKRPVKAMAMDPEDFGNDYDDDLRLYRNLAISRLVKKALDDNAIEVAGRSGSKTPQLSALWKTRVG